MNYVFCGAYKQLFFALYLKNLGEKVTIIIWDNDIKKYCRTINLDYIYFEPIWPGVKTFYKVVDLKNRLDNLIEKIDFGKEDCFYLLSNAIGYEAFYLAKEFSKKGVVYFKNSEKQLKRFKPKLKDFFNKNTVKYSFIRSVMRHLLKITMDLDLIFYETNKIPRFGIDDKFLEENNIVKILQDQDFNDIVFDAIKKQKTSQKKYENLIIGEFQGITCIVKYDSIKKVFKNLLKLLPLEPAFKRHPYRPGDAEAQIDILFKELFKNCKDVPDYIPVELYFNNIKNNVIAIMSASLITASKLKHLKAISLLELVEWYHQSYKNEIKDWLKKSSKNKILFPASFEELKKLFSSGVMSSKDPYVNTV